MALLMIFLVTQLMPCKVRILSTLSLSVWFCDGSIRYQLGIRGPTCLGKLSIEIKSGDIVWGGHRTNGLQLATRRRVAEEEGDRTR